MLIYFLGCLHNDPFHGESALKLVSRIPSGAKGVRFVGLENSEANHALMVSWRPQLRDELQHTLPWLPTPLLNGFVASLSWEPDFAKNLWSGVALTWMDERPIDIRCVESKVVAIKTLLSRAGVTEGQDLKEAIHRVQLRGHCGERSESTRDESPRVLRPRHKHVRKAQIIGRRCRSHGERSRDSGSKAYGRR